MARNRDDEAEMRFLDVFRRGGAFKHLNRPAVAAIVLVRVVRWCELRSRPAAGHQLWEFCGICFVNPLSDPKRRLPGSKYLSENAKVPRALLNSPSTTASIDG